MHQLCINYSKNVFYTLHNIKNDTFPQISFSSKEKLYQVGNGSKIETVHRNIFLFLFFPRFNISKFFSQAVEEKQDNLRN